MFQTIRFKVNGPNNRCVIGDPWLQLDIHIVGDKHEKAQTIDTWHGVPIE
jgi:hypothetical protein